MFHILTNCNTNWTIVIMSPINSLQSINSNFGQPILQKFWRLIKYDNRNRALMSVKTIKQIVKHLPIHHYLVEGHQYIRKDTSKAVNMNEHLLIF